MLVSVTTDETNIEQIQNFFFLIPRIGEYIWIKEKEAAVFQPKGDPFLWHIISPSG